MKRNQKLIIIISSEEKERIRNNAKLCGLSITAYARFLLLHTKPQIISSPV